MSDLHYGDKIIEMRGIVTEIHDGMVAMDLKGRLGTLRIPRRMLISDYEVKVGQETGFNMSFIEVLSDEVDEKYTNKIKAMHEKEERDKLEK